MNVLLPLAMTLLLLASPPLGEAKNKEWSDWFRLEGGQPLTVMSSPGASFSIHLEDGTLANVQILGVEPHMPGHLQGDDFSVTITAGRSHLAALRMWASYGHFAIALADLVNGPGDELLIVSQHGRGSPLFKPVLQVWALDKVGPRQIAELEVGSFVSPCAFWREQVILAGREKPHSLRLLRQIASDTCPETPEVTAARNVAEREMTFSRADGRFVLVERASKP